MFMGSSSTYPIGRTINTIRDTIRRNYPKRWKEGKGLVICFAAGNEDLPTYLSVKKIKWIRIL